jgi:hypothetical protein
MWLGSPSLFPLDLMRLHQLVSNFSLSDYLRRVFAVFLRPREMGLAGKAAPDNSTTGAGTTKDCNEYINNL